ncbi:MAG: stage III sporulation protein AE [Candidatus Improbicoccus devescovinae]|nr:MAG: stage III sporulation protein AE [Candidatus Improbicoccus devescovinae]
MDFNKIIKKFILIIFFFMILNKINIYASENIYNSHEYNKQFKISGADKLKEKLPENILKSLEDFGIYDNNILKITNINIEKIIIFVKNSLKEKIKTPLKIIASVMGIILISIFLKSFIPIHSGSNYENIFNKINTCLIILILLTPILYFVKYISVTLRCASGFVLCFAPIISGIGIATGKPIVSASYGAIMACGCQNIYNWSEKIFENFFEILLGISIISAINLEVKFNKICDLFYKFLLFSLSFISIIFTSLISWQNLVSNSLRNTSEKSIKFLFNIVPLIGGILGEASTGVAACLDILKSTVGVFGMISVSVIFLPPIIECAVWILSINICVFLSESFSISNISVLLNLCEKVIKILFAFLIFSLTVFILCTTLILK